MLTFPAARLSGEMVDERKFVAQQSGRQAMKTTGSSAAKGDGARERDRALERTLRDALALAASKKVADRALRRLAPRRTMPGGAIFAVSPPPGRLRHPAHLHHLAPAAGPETVRRIGPEALRKGAGDMDMNGAISKNNFKHRRGPLRSWLLGRPDGGYGRDCRGLRLVVSGTAAAPEQQRRPSGQCLGGQRDDQHEKRPRSGHVLVNRRGRPCTC